MIAWDTNREEAIKRMRRALSTYKLTGIKTNIRFLDRIMETPAFARGKYNTQFIGENEDFLMRHEEADKTEEDIALAILFLHHNDKANATANGNGNGNDQLHTVSKQTQSAWKHFAKHKNVGRL